jgi:hypothetical protein
MYGGDLIIVERRVTFRSGSDVAIGSERLCDLLGEERAERDACDPPDNFADQGTGVMGWYPDAAPGVHHGAWRASGRVIFPRLSQGVQILDRQLLGPSAETGGMGQQMADLNAFFPGRGELRPNWPVRVQFSICSRA